MSNYQNWKRFNAAVDSQNIAELRSLSKYMLLDEFAELASAAYERLLFEGKADNPSTYWIRSWFSERPHYKLTESLAVKEMRRLGYPIPFDSY